MIRKFFEDIGRYFMLMGKVFSHPERLSVYYRRTIFEMEALGFNSIALTAIISTFIGAVIVLQMAITLESAFIPPLYDWLLGSRGYGVGVLLDCCCSYPCR